MCWLQNLQRKISSRATLDAKPLENPPKQRSSGSIHLCVTLTTNHVCSTCSPWPRDLSPIPRDQSTSRLDLGFSLILLLRTIHLFGPPCEFRRMALQLRAILLTCKPTPASNLRQKQYYRHMHVRNFLLRRAGGMRRGSVVRTYGHSMMTRTEERGAGWWAFGLCRVPWVIYI